MEDIGPVAVEDIRADVTGMRTITVQEDRDNKEEDSDTTGKELNKKK